MTDIHSHFIFQVDDGANSLRDSLIMLEQAASCGIEKLIATPHISDTANEEGSKRIQQNFYKIQESLEKHQIPVKIFMGSELYYNEFILKWQDAAWYTFNDKKKYLLFELPLFDLPLQVADFIFQCKLKGITPILAHPERYLYLSNRFDLLRSWYAQGCMLQMNAGSILGQFGSRIAQFSEQLLSMNLYHFVASDAHDLVDRNYKTMSLAYQRLLEIIDEDHVHDLFNVNTSNAVDGNTIMMSDFNDNLKHQGHLKKVLKKIIKMPKKL